jgi:CHAT domain-containing protein
LEERFKENKTSPSLIHIATHGFSFPAPDKDKEYTLFENSFIHNLNPLFRSGLLFSGANRTWSGAKPIEGVEDGILTAYEVSNLNLSNTKLVVLSACETGLGELKGNEGVYGLQRAFKMAGVKYIVMSLWQVPDAQTVELMDYFYKELLSGKTVRKAFTLAQNNMKLKYDPYYWAAFVLVE